MGSEKLTFELIGDWWQVGEIVTLDHQHWRIVWKDETQATYDVVEVREEDVEESW